jgi:DNA-binding transcriptional ArsR family regulator
MIFNYMVKFKRQAAEEARLDAVFGALADGTRRAILSRLAEGPAAVTELAEPFAMSLPAVSKHLKVLERAGLLLRDKEGRVHRCRLETAPMTEASSWIEETRLFWQSQFDRLDRYLRKQRD